MEHAAAANRTEATLVLTCSNQYCCNIGLMMDVVLITDIISDWIKIRVGYIRG